MRWGQRTPREVPSIFVYPVYYHFQAEPPLVKRDNVLILKPQEWLGSEKGKPVGRRGRKAAGPYVVGRATGAGRLEAVVARLFLGGVRGVSHTSMDCRTTLCRSEEAAT